MGQTEVLDLLNKYKGHWLTSKQVRELLGLGSSSITNSLMRLKRYKEIRCKANPERKQGFLYSSK